MLSVTSQGAWFPTRRPKPNARLRVFCLPYAGGSASAYNGWGESLPADVELCAVQLPGRERRFQEPPIRELSTLVEALDPVLSPLLDRPFVLFGYSMGTRIALALTQRWQARGAPLPLGLVVSAAGAPHLPRRSSAGLDDAAFIELLRSYEGVPAEFFAERELLELLLPTLRADFAIAESALAPVPVRCPVSAWGGTEDPHVSAEGLERWRELTTAGFRLRRFPGKHFFLRSAQQQVLAALREELEGWWPAPTPHPVPLPR